MQQAVFFEISGWEQQYVKRRLKNTRVLFVDKPLTKETISKAAGADIISVFIYSRLDRQAIRSVKKAALVTTRSTGFDHIDLEACRKRKITVSNVPFYGENTVAEHTFALMLSISRNIHKAYMHSLQRDYSIEGLKGFDLKAKTLGVIGVGHIGLHVIRIAKGFGMNVLAYDVRPNKYLSEILDFEYGTLEEVLGRADIVSLHVPLLPSTRHIINRETIRYFKKGALLINTSRGELVDTDALLMALDRKILGGAGLDVIEGEQLVMEDSQILADPSNEAKLAGLAKNQMLLGRKDVVYTPHIAFYSQEALERILDTTIQNIAAFQKGAPANVVA